MHAVGYLYDDICAWDNIMLALHEVYVNGDKNNPKILDIGANPEYYAQQIQEMLILEEVVVSDFKIREIFEKGKKRRLEYTPIFPDGAIQHCIVQVVGPILMGTYIYDSYASIPGKGLHQLNSRIVHVMGADPEGTKYCAKLDFKSYYDSIRRPILKKLIRRKIKCPRTLALIDKYIDAAPGDRGIPIGNFLSNLLSNYYLTPLDHYCKEVLRIEYYFRYMDDVVILAESKEQLHYYVNCIRKFAWFQLHLRLKDNYQVFPVDARGVDFVGFVFYHNKVRIRRRNKLSFIRSCNRVVDAIKHKNPVTDSMLMSIVSYDGFLKWGDAKHLRKKYLDRVGIAMDIGAEALC